jgi:hypothetical protein
MRPFTRRLAPLAVLACALAIPASASATATKKQIKTATASGVSYLKSLQQEDGSFETDWVLGALAAAGHAAATVTPAGGSIDARSWYRSLTGDTATWPGSPSPSVSEFERAALNGYAAGIDPARVSRTQNLIAQIVARYQPANPGYYGPPASFTGTVFGLLALGETNAKAKVHRVPVALLDKSVAVLKANQHSDGGWTYEQAEGNPTTIAAPSEPDETGAAIAAMCGAGVPTTDPSIVKALSYLKGDLETSSGAFEAPFGPNTDSTAWAVQGLDACGLSPQEAGFTTSAGKTPIDFLISQQQLGGGFVYEAGEEEANEYSSQDALRSLAGAGFTASPPSAKGAPHVLAERGFEHGVSSPLAVVVDNGSTLQACSVTVSPEGATTTLQAVLTAAQAASSPSGCVTGFTTIGGNQPITQINGSPSPGAANWKLSIDGGKEKAAKASSKISLGDTIYLHLA